MSELDAEIRLKQIKNKIETIGIFGWLLGALLFAILTVKNSPDETLIDHSPETVHEKISKDISKKGIVEKGKILSVNCQIKYNPDNSKQLIAKEAIVFLKLSNRRTTVYEFDVKDNLCFGKYINSTVKVKYDISDMNNIVNSIIYL